jgi:predicted dehydrogenase
MKTNLTAGVIGLGVGECHIIGYDNHASCSVTKICDFNKEVLENVAKRHEGKLFTTDPMEIISDPEIDIVSIASYDEYHCDQVIASLRSGKHVFVEKPLCVSRTELNSIVEVLRENSKLKLSSNLILRNTPRFKELRNRVKSNELGQVFHIESSYDYGRLHKITNGWRGEMPKYSVTLGGGIHLIDLLSWISGERFHEVFAYGNDLSTRGSSFSGNSLTTAIMKAESGFTATLTSNFGSVTPHHHKLTIYGTKGTFEQSHSTALYYSSRDSFVAPEKVDSLYPGTKKGDLIYDFIDLILGKRMPIINAQEVVDSMSVGLAIDDSIETQRPQKVQYKNLDE